MATSDAGSDAVAAVVAEVEEKVPAVEDKPAADRLQELIKSASLQYSIKNYTGAADLYSEAAALQDEIHGEMSIQNADLLYQYGRCLYHVAVANSDVLGGKAAVNAAANDAATAEKPRKKARIEKSDTNGKKEAEGESSKAAAESSEVKDEEKESDAKDESKPFFQITGDENWDDSDEEGEGEEGEGGDAPAEEEDDLGNAYEILDVARVLLSRKLEALQQQKTTDALESAGMAPTLEAEQRTVKERLADTHDLQAEICLENERFADAVTDSRQALILKQELYPVEHNLVAEAHYKLSLALEFAAVTPANPEAPAAAGQEASTAEPSEPKYDENLRKEAATEMEAAIASCKKRMEKEESSLETLTGEELEKRQANIKDVKEMVDEMQQRLVDLRNPPVSINGPDKAATNEASQIQDILNEMRSAQAGGALSSLNKYAEQLAADSATATAGATALPVKDISGVIKRKPKGVDADVMSVSSVTSAGEKRKLDNTDDANGSSDANGKKARVETVPDEEA